MACLATDSVDQPSTAAPTPPPTSGMRLPTHTPRRLPVSWLSERSSSARATWASRRASNTGAVATSSGDDGSTPFDTNDAVVLGPSITIRMAVRTRGSASS